MQSFEYETGPANILIFVNVTGYEPYVPAKISGPSEFCYPEEGGEAEFYFSFSEEGRDAYLLNYTDYIITNKERNIIHDWVIERLEQDFDDGYDDY